MWERFYLYNHQNEWIKSWGIYATQTDKMNKNIYKNFKLSWYGVKTNIGLLIGIIQAKLLSNTFSFTMKKS